jgi:ligand-binding SRPBCC domain-containing protein
MRLERTTIVPAPLERVFLFFSDPKNLGLITPPSMGFRILEGPERPLRAGDRIRYRIRVGGLPLTWVTRITAWDENRRFADLQEKGPYANWHHTHEFEAVEGGVKMTDIVEYELPFGRLGALFGGWFVRRQLARIFDYRAKVIRDYFTPQ